MAMFDSLLSLFSKSKTYTTPVPEADANHAFGALMVRIAKADRAYLFEELERIDQVLADRVGLNVVEAAKFRAECEKLEEAMPSTAELGDILKTELDEPEREEMFRALWAVLMADGLKHRNEQEILSEVADIFGFTAAQAKSLTR